MATIANLGVSLTARIGNFEKGFKKAQKIAGNFASDIGRHVRTVASYGAALAGVAIGTGAYFVQQQLEAVDATSKLSRAIGLQTENLIGLEHAGNLAGVSAEMIATSVEQLTKRIGEARTGGGSMVTFLKQYDANLLKAIQTSKSADQALALVADAIKNASDEQAQAAVASAAFGRSGIKMVEIFRELGADAIPQARKEMERLGLSFSAVDGKAVEEANDALTRIQSSVSGIARRIAVQLAPYIKVVADRFLAFAIAANQNGEVVTNAVSNIMQAAGKLVDVINLLRAGWSGFVSLVTGSAALILSPIKLGTEAVNKFLELLGVEPTETAFDAVFDGFVEASKEAAAQASAFLSDFANGDASKQAAAVFKGLKAEAAAFRDSLEKGIVPDVSNAFEAGRSTTKAAEFKQVDLSRIAVGGAGGRNSTQKVEDPQLKTTNDLLRGIRISIGTPVLTA